MKFNEAVFKAYDIRGKVPSELNADVVHAIACAFADMLPEGKIAVGRDMRLDSAQLATALIKGLVQQGREVIDLGQITSDMIYFAVGKMGLAGGAMITASHNPGEYNGIKLTGKGVSPIGQDTGLQTIKQAVLEDDFKNSQGEGKSYNQDILVEWIDHALGFAPNLETLKVGIDAGNGMAGIDVAQLQQKTKLQIEGIYLEPDGNFPNHPANPLVVENLKDLSHLVVDKQLDCGIAFDGDGDRAIMVDEAGTPVSPSIIGAILAEHFLEQHPNSVVLYNAITSRIVPDTIEKLGGKAVRTRVGHSFIKQAMAQHHAVFACEHSGHYYFQDNYNADSGLIAALCVLQIMSTKKQRLSQLVGQYEGKYFDSGEINFEVSSKGKAMDEISSEYADAKIDTLDGLTASYGDWWFNLRPSNTEPLLRLNVEATSQSVMQENLDQITKILQKHID